MPKVTSNLFVVTITALLIASIVSAAYMALSSPLSGQWNLSSIYMTFLVALFFSFIGNFFLGIPIFLVLIRFKLIRWWIWLPVALIAGVLLEFGLRGKFSYWDIRDLQLTIPLALICAFVFRATLGFIKGWKFGSN